MMMSYELICCSGYDENTGSCVCLGLSGRDIRRTLGFVFEKQTGEMYYDASTHTGPV